MALPERILVFAITVISLAAPACGEPLERGDDSDSGGAAGAPGGGKSGGGGSLGSAGAGAGAGGSGGVAGSSPSGGAAAGAGVSGGSSGADSGGASSAGAGAVAGASSGGSGAGAGTGASSGASAGGAAGMPEPGGFTLLWHDDFDTLDTTRWGTASHTFEENLAQFAPAGVVVEGGFLKLRLSAAPAGSAKPYLSGEVRTHAEFTHGRFETRARFARGSGLVSSLFTFYDHLPMDWNEIDIEFLGRYSDRLQYNTIFWDSAQARQTHEHIDVLDFDPAGDFHVYAIEWLPGEVRFLVDGELRHTETEGISSYMRLPQKVMMNLWPANVAAWVGPVDASAIPTESQYDWVKVYALAP